MSISHDFFVALTSPKERKIRENSTCTMPIAIVMSLRGHALSTYAKRGGGGVLPLRTPLHKCDVTYVVSPAYKRG